MNRESFEGSAGATDAPSDSFVNPQSAIRNPQSGGSALRNRRSEGRLLDLRWLLAIASVPWSWHLLPGSRVAQLAALGALFLWFARPSLARERRPRAGEGRRSKW